MPKVLSTIRAEPAERVIPAMRGTSATRSSGFEIVSTTTARGFSFSTFSSRSSGLQASKKRVSGAGRAEDLHHEGGRRAVELVGGQHRTLAAALRRREGRVHGGHPGGEGERPAFTSFTFEGGQRLLEGNDGGVVVAGVAVAFLLAAEHPVRRLDVRM